MDRVDTFGDFVDGRGVTQQINTYYLMKLLASATGETEHADYSCEHLIFQ